jgi:hypothetical protein
VARASAHDNSERKRAMWRHKPWWMSQDSLNRLSLLSSNLGQKKGRKIDFQLIIFFEIQFLKNNAYLIDIVLFDRMCDLFFLLSPKTIPKTGVKTNQNTTP